MPADFKPWYPWPATPALQSVSGAPAPAQPQPLTYLKRVEAAPVAQASYNLHDMPPSSKSEVPVGRKVMMLGLFFVFWLITSAFFMNLYIARYLS
ncbi:MAG: hypothetical protein RhofKO_30450 [Rhodothermales bacterium]